LIAGARSSRKATGFVPKENRLSGWAETVSNFLDRRGRTAVCGGAPGRERLVPLSSKPVGMGAQRRERAKVPCVNDLFHRNSPSQPKVPGRQTTPIDALGWLIQGSRNSLDAQPMGLVAQSFLIGVLPKLGTGSAVLNLRAGFTVQRLIVGHALCLSGSKKSGAAGSLA
jgi:hypothetical protein